MRKEDVFEERTTATCCWLEILSRQYICVFNLHLTMIFKRNYIFHTKDNNLLSIIFLAQRAFCNKASEAAEITLV